MLTAASAKPESPVDRYHRELASSDEMKKRVDDLALIIRSALKRKESRGLHYTLDYLDRDDKNYALGTILRARNFS